MTWTNLYCEYSEHHAEWKKSDTTGYMLPWPVWLPWQSIIPQSETVASSWSGHVYRWRAAPRLGVCKGQLISVSLTHRCFPLSLLLSLKINKVFFLSHQNLWFFLKILFLFLERGERREKERERKIDVQEKHQLITSLMSPTGDLACNPGMCPEWELNQWPLGSQASTQSTEPYQPGQMNKIHIFLKTSYCLIAFIWNDQNM